MSLRDRVPKVTHAWLKDDMKVLACDPSWDGGKWQTVRAVRVFRYTAMVEFTTREGYRSHMHIAHANIRPLPPKE